jgi:hypothetical protein
MRVPRTLRIPSDFILSTSVHPIELLHVSRGDENRV